MSWVYARTMSPERRYRLLNHEANRQIDVLLENLRVPTETWRYESELLTTALKLHEDGAQVADLKIASAALKELRYGFKVFAPYKSVPKVTVFGSARTAADHPVSQQARRFGKRMIESGWMVITGAGSGIMGAAQEGAGRERSFGVNIRLPFEQDANPWIADDPKLITFKYFFTRKLFLVREAHAMAFFPGGFGTCDEAFEALTLTQTGKQPVLPLVLVDEPGVCVAALEALIELLGALPRAMAPARIEAETMSEDKEARHDATTAVRRGATGAGVDERGAVGGRPRRDPRPRPRTPGRSPAAGRRRDAARRGGAR